MPTVWPEWVPIANTVRQIRFNDTQYTAIMTHVRNKFESLLKTWLNHKFLPFEKWLRLRYTIYSFTITYSWLILYMYSLVFIVGNSIKTDDNLFHIWNWLLFLTKVQFYALIFLGLKLTRESVYSMLYGDGTLQIIWMIFFSWMLKWGTKIMKKLCQTALNHFRKIILCVETPKRQQQFTINNDNIIYRSSFCLLISLYFFLVRRSAGFYLSIFVHFYAQPNEINCHCISNSIVYLIW